MGAKELNHVQQELFEAVRRGDSHKVNAWLLNRKNRRPRTPLNFLRSSAPQSAWLCLITDPSNGYTVLHLAALLGHKGVITILLNVDPQLVRAKDRRGCLPIHLAAWNGHVDVLQFLIDADIATVDAVNNAKESALHLSAQHGHGKVVAMLLSKHANARLRNARAETALDVAARLGRTSVCRLIICSCPELALQSAAECSTIDATRSRHISPIVYPLHAAARHGHIDCLDALCDSGFDLNYVTEEGSALHVAALFGKVEAVKLLLKNGIGLDIRDIQGRTVLETLKEHENEIASDLTQVIQSREGWSECRQLIEGFMKKYEGSVVTNSQSIECATPPIYLNLPQCSTNKMNDSDVIWRPIPEASAARQRTRRHRVFCGPIPVAHSVSDNRFYYPPSVMADLVKGTNDEQDFDDLSTLSLSTTLIDSHEVNSSNQPSPSRRTTATEYRNTASQLSDHDVVAYYWNATRKPGMCVESPLCFYQAPIAYDAWRPRHVGTYDNVIASPHPLKAYDNVPRNFLVYDNAPPPGHRRWHHFCEEPKMCNRCFISLHKNVTCNDIQTIPLVKPMRDHALKTEQENERGLRPQRFNTSKIIETNQALFDNLPSSTRLERAESRIPVVTFACSVLEGLSTEELLNSKSSTKSLMEGRAPLAVPEEISVSASASVLSMCNSSQPFINEKIEDCRNSVSLQNDSYSSDRNSAATVLHSSPSPMSNVLKTVALTDEQSEVVFESDRCDLDCLPSPETTESRIHQFLCCQDGVKHHLSPSPTIDKKTQKDFLSPSSTIGSDCTLASSCSLPVISHMSSISPSLISPLHEKNQLYHQSSIDDQSFSSMEIKLRNSPPSFHNFTNSKNFSASISSDSEPYKDDFDLNPQRSGTYDCKFLLQHSSLNESIEWEKITGIMESFGGAVCRESVFAAHYEPKVAVYLRDRRSQALTLQLNGPSQTTQSDSFTSQNSNKGPKNYRELKVTVADWLNISVGIPNPRALEIAEILKSNGFDNVDHMKTLDRIAMQEIGLDKSTQHQIEIFLKKSIAISVPSASTFTYVSDWLHSLDLEDYLGHFVHSGLTSMLIVLAANTSRKHLKALGITKVGHQRRILNSLEEAKEDSQLKATNNTVIALQKHGSGNVQKNRGAVHSSPYAQPLVVTTRAPCTRSIWHHSHKTLIDHCVSYSAHYFGSLEISNVEQTEDSKRAMIKLKKGIREIAKVPHVTLEISVAGVRIFNATSEQLTVEHEITRIKTVYQDERDLNCFAYISQDGNRHFCHVFCVLTADAATEIIITLGQAFEICYKMASNFYVNMRKLGNELV